MCMSIVVKDWLVFLYHWIGTTLDQNAYIMGARRDRGYYVNPHCQNKPFGILIPYEQ